MRYTDLATGLAKVLSLLVFGELVYIEFFKSRPRKIVGGGWQATILPTMAYSPSEDIFVLEEDNLDYLLSRILNRQKRRKAPVHSFITLSRPNPFLGTRTSLL